MTSSPENDQSNLSELSQQDLEEHPQRNVPLSSATTDDVPSFGWSAYAERVNGRFAMIGFGAVLLIEALSRDTFLHWAGLIP